MNRANLTKSDNRHESTTGISISKYNRKKEVEKKIEEKKSRGGWGRDWVRGRGRGWKRRRIGALLIVVVVGRSDRCLGRKGRETEG